MITFQGHEFLGNSRCRQFGAAKEASHLSKLRENYAEFLQYGAIRGLSCEASPPVAVCGTVNCLSFFFFGEQKKQKDLYAAAKRKEFT